MFTSSGPEKSLFYTKGSFSNLELPNGYYHLQTPEKENKIHVETKKKLKKTVRAANGENICTALKLGLKRCAANFVPFGTQLSIDNYGVCTVTDRMNRRYRNRVDIAMKVTEKEKALQFGVKKLKVTILRSSD